MAIEVTPRGTRGQKPPRIPQFITSAMNGVYRVFSGRMGNNLLLLTTVGAKTGKHRTTLLGWFPDGPEAWLIVASYAGSAKHPAWYLNLAKNPEHAWIELGKRKVKVTAESLNGAAREAAWQRIVSKSPGYAGYQEKTDREIPVVRLTPAQ